MAQLMVNNGTSMKSDVVDGVDVADSKVPSIDYDFLVMGGVKPSQALAVYTQRILDADPTKLSETDKRAMGELWMEEATGGFELDGSTYFGKPAASGEELFQNIRKRVNPVQFGELSTPIGKFNALPPEEQLKKASEWFQVQENGRVATRRSAAELEFKKSQGAGYYATGQSAPMNLAGFSFSEKPRGFGELSQEEQARAVVDYKNQVVFPEDRLAVRDALEKQMIPAAKAYAIDYLRSGRHVKEVFASFDENSQELISSYIQLNVEAESPGWLKERVLGEAIVETGGNLVRGAQATVQDGLLSALSMAFEGEAVAGDTLDELSKQRRTEFFLRQSERNKYPASSNTVAGFINRGAEGLAGSLPFTALAMVPGVGLGLAAVSEGQRVTQDLEFNEGVDPATARALGFTYGAISGYIERLQVDGALNAGAAVRAIATNQRAAQAAKDLGVAISKGYGTQVIQESSQTFLEAYAKEIGTGEFDLDRAARAVYEAMPDILATSAWFSVVFGGVGAGREALLGSEPYESTAELKDKQRVTNEKEARWRDLVASAFMPPAVGPITNRTNRTDGTNGVEIPFNVSPEMRAASDKAILDVVDGVDVVDYGAAQPSPEATAGKPDYMSWLRDGAEISEDQQKVFEAYFAQPEGTQKTWLRKSGIQDVKAFEAAAQEYRAIFQQSEGVDLDRIDFAELQLAESEAELKRIRNYELGIKNEELTAVVDQLAVNFPGALPVRVVESMADLPSYAKAPAGSRAKAVYVAGSEVIFVRDQITDRADLVRQWGHEQFAHRGLDLRTPEGKTAALTELKASIEEAGGSIADVRRLLEEYQGQEAQLRERWANEGLFQEEIDERVDSFILEEFLGRTAEKVLNGETLTVEEQGFWNRVLDWVKARLGFSSSAKASADDAAGSALDEAMSRAAAEMVLSLARELQITNDELRIGESVDKAKLGGENQGDFDSKDVVDGEGEQLTLFSLAEPGDSEAVRAEKKRNALSALNALDKVLAGGEGTSANFYHREIGKIRLDWGFAGTPESGFKAGGYGLEHIMARRLTEGNPVNIVPKTIVNVLLAASTGKIVGKNDRRFELEFNGYKAVLTRKWDDQEFVMVLSGYEIYKADEQKKAKNLASDYALGPFGGLARVGAALRSAIPQLIAKVKADDVKFSITPDDELYNDGSSYAKASADKGGRFSDPIAIAYNDEKVIEGAFLVAERMLERSAVNAPSMDFEGKVVPNKFVMKNRGTALTVADVKRLVPELSDKEAEAALKQGREVALQMTEEENALLGDSQMKRVLRTRANIAYYQDVLTTQRQGGRLEGARFQLAKQRLKELAQRERREELAQVQGLSRNELYEKGYTQAFKELLVPSLTDAALEKVDAPPIDFSELERKKKDKEASIPSRLIKKPLTSPRQEGRDEQLATPARVLLDGLLDDSIDHLLEQGVLASKNKAALTDARTRTAFKKSFVELIEPQIRELTYGKNRERLIGLLQEFEDISTMPAAMARAERLINLVNLWQIRDTREKMIKEVWKIITWLETGDINEKTGREKRVRIPRYRANQDLEKAIFTPRMALYVKFIRKALNSTDEEVELRIDQLQRILGGEVAPGVNPESKFADAELELLAFRKFGALDSDVRTTADVAQIRDTLKGDLLADFQAQEDRREAVKKQGAYFRDGFMDALKEMKARKGRGSNSVYQDVVADSLMLEDFLQDWVRFGSKEDKAKAKELFNQIVYAENTKYQHMFEAMQYFNDGMVEIFPSLKKAQILRGQDAFVENLVQDRYYEPRKDLQRFSENGERAMALGEVLHIYGGIVQADYRDMVNNEKLQRQVAMKEEIEKLLEPEDYKVLDLMRGYFERARPALSKVGENVEGQVIDSGQRLYLPVQIKNPSTMVAPDGGFSVQYLNPIYSVRVQHMRPLRDDVNIFSLFSERISDNAQYLGYGELNLVLRSILNDQELKSLSEEAHGESYTGRISLMLKEQMVGRVKGDRDGTMFVDVEKFAKVFSQLALGGNVTTALKQPLGISAFATRLSHRETLQFFTDMASPEWQDAYQQVKNSWQYKDRVSGNFVDLMEPHFMTARSTMDGKTKRARQKAARAFSQHMNHLMKTNSYGDSWVVAVAAPSIYLNLMQKPEFQGLPREVARERAMAMTFHLIEQTQQSTRLKDLSAYRRTRGLSKGIGAFMSTPMQYFSDFISAWRQFDGQHGNPFAPKNWGLVLQGTTPEAKRFRNAFFEYHVVLPLAWSLGTTVLNWLFFGDEPDEDDVVQAVMAMLAGPYAGVFLLGGFAITLSESAIKGQAPWGPGSIVKFEGFTDSAAAVGRMGHALIEQDPEKFMDSMDRALRIYAPYRFVSKVAEAAGEEN